MPFRRQEVKGSGVDILILFHYLRSWSGFMPQFQVVENNELQLLIASLLKNRKFWPAIKLIFSFISTFEKLTIVNDKL
jgi:hypothetical protein